MATYRYTCEGQRSILIDEDEHGPNQISQAAETFATRAARQKYGPKGHVRSLRADNWARDHSSVTYEAFIGKPERGDPNTTAGGNVWLTVYCELYRGRRKDIATVEQEYVLVRSDQGDGGWSLHMAGSTDDMIANGEAPELVSGQSAMRNGQWLRPNSKDYIAARRALAERFAAT